MDQHPQPVYNVVCLAGHVSTAEHGSKLETRCIEREKQGKLDALVILSSECEECAEDERMARRRAHDLVGLDDWGWVS